MQRSVHIMMAALVTMMVAAASPSRAESLDRSGNLPARSASLPTDREAPRARARAAAPRALNAGPAVLAPIGWVDFCAAAGHETDCKVSALPAQTLHADASTRALIERVNRNVNAAVAPMSDMENYGVEELWTYPDNGRGDCEDYVLLKRRLLIDAGLARQALLITVVREANGDGHAVLTIVTDKGDIVLDNKRDDIRAWNATGYDFIKRQSAEDPNVWVDLRAAAAQIARR